MKLTNSEINFIQLVNRSKDTGDGWKKVSSLLWRLVDQFDKTRPELIEHERLVDGSGRVRLTERGKIVADYVI